MYMDNENEVSNSQNAVKDVGSLGSFGAALIAMHDGKKVFRKGWHLGGMWLKIQYPDSHSANNLPYIYIVIPGFISPQGDKPAERVPWVVSHTDMLASDWYEVIN